MLRFYSTKVLVSSAPHKDSGGAWHKAAILACGLIRNSLSENRNLAMSAESKCWSVGRGLNVFGSGNPVGSLSRLSPNSTGVGCDQCAYQSNCF